MNKIIFLVLIFLALPLVSAQNTIEFTFTINQEDIVNLESIRTSIGTYDGPMTFESNYAIELLSEEEYFSYFPITWYRTETFYEFKEMIFIKKLPYTSNEGTINIYHEDQLIFSQSLDILCNSNKICEQTENYISCPLDCTLDQEDNLCINQEDNLCDPDCYTGLDVDCEEVVEQPEEKLTSYIWFVLIAIFAIILIVIWFVKRKH